jgi:hypothetical protein
VLLPLAWRCTVAATLALCLGAFAPSAFDNSYRITRLGLVFDWGDTAARFAADVPFQIQTLATFFGTHAYSKSSKALGRNAVSLDDRSVVSWIGA